MRVIVLEERSDRCEDLSFFLVSVLQVDLLVPCSGSYSSSPYLSVIKFDLGLVSQATIWWQNVPPVKYGWLMCQMGSRVTAILGCNFSTQSTSQLGCNFNTQPQYGYMVTACARQNCQSFVKNIFESASSTHPFENNCHNFFWLHFGLLVLSSNSCSFMFAI